MDIKLTHRIRMGKSGRKPPVVYDLDWNPIPENCKGKDALAMLACVSSIGTHVYYCSRHTNTWSTMVINYRPSREGRSIKWHRKGTSVVSTSDPGDGKPAQLRLLNYDSENLYFGAEHGHHFDEHTTLSSLIWVSNGDDLIVAACPHIHFFKLDESIDQTATKLKHLGSKLCNGFPDNTSIALQAHPFEDYFFACAAKAETILVWGEVADDPTGINWVILQSVKCGSGLNSMSFFMLDEGLISIEKDCWKYWSFTKCPGDHLNFEFKEDHASIKQKKTKLGLVAASTAGNLLACVGWGATLIIHKCSDPCDPPLNWKIVAQRINNVCFGRLNCVKFEVQNDLAMRHVATGGDTGFIHVWVVINKGSKVTIASPQRRYEPSYYGTKNVDVPSSDLELHDDRINSDDVVEGSVERLVEYVDEAGDDEEDLERKANKLKGEGEAEREKEKEKEKEKEERLVEYVDEVGDDEENLERKAKKVKGEGEAEKEKEKEKEKDEKEKEMGEGEKEHGVGAEGRVQLIERCDDIITDAEDIFNLIKAGAVVPEDTIQSLCLKILNDKEKIRAALKEDP